MEDISTWSHTALRPVSFILEVNINSITLNTTTVTPYVFFDVLRGFAKLKVARLPAN